MKLKEIVENWDDEDDKLKVKTDRDFVSCDEGYEIQAYIQEFGRKKVLECCAKVPPPRTREDFEQCLKCNV